jgi:type II secretory pathway component PulK
MKPVLHNENGIALVITLLVVALLTITVVEFTFSVEVDQRMARNALDSVQASLLARSGINFGEAVLLQDDQIRYDAFTENWCVDNDGQPTNGNIPSCDFDLDGKLGLPADIGLRVRIYDEGGKFNVNNARPQNQGECALLENPDANPQVSIELRLKALGQLLESRGMGPEALESFQAYWRQVCDSVAGVPAGQVTPGATAQPTPVTSVSSQQFALALQQQEFTSLDDMGFKLPGFSAGAIRRLRPLLTASPRTVSNLLVNVNTAPREVLRAILGVVDGGAEQADDIISQRGDQPFQQPPALGARPSGMPLGVTSTTFLIQASAVVKRNPVTLRGGIGRTASMLVRRSFRPGVPQQTNAGATRYTLTQLDWYKEGGAVLFQKAAQEPGAEDPSMQTAPEG